MRRIAPFVMTAIMVAGIAASGTPALAHRSITPVQAPSAQGCVPVATVVNGPANLRTGPGTNFSVQTTVPQNVSVPVTGRTADSSWYQVTFNGLNGWIAASLLAPSCVQNVPVVNANPPNPANPVGPSPSNPFNVQVSANNVAPNTCVTISWSVSNVQAVFFGDGSNMQGVGGNDSRQVCPASTTTYQLRVVYNNGQTVNQPITINVVNASQNPANFQANPASVTIPGCTTLSWSIDQNLVYGVYLNERGNWRGVPADGNSQECPTTPTTYKLRVRYKNGQQVETALNVPINNVVPVQASFTANPTTIARGQCSTLQWTVANFQSVYLVDTGAGSTTLVGPTGNIQVCPQNTSTYILRITGLDGSLVQPQVTVYVGQP
jgi:hypothetical protein